jgi:hypothetical protein
MKYRAIAIWLGALLLCQCCMGCGSGIVKPTGKLVRNGKPFTLSQKGMITMVLYKEDDKEGKVPYPIEMRPPQGPGFEVVGRDRNGVPPGKYRVSIRAWDPYPAKSDRDFFGNRFNVPQTPLTREIKGNEEIVIDVGKGL